MPPDAHGVGTVAVTKRRVRLGLTSGAVRRFAECRRWFGTDRRLLARAVQSLGRGSIVNYAVIFEQGESNLGAWVPDLPGCVAVGDALEERSAERCRQSDAVTDNRHTHQSAVDGIDATTTTRASCGAARPTRRGGGEEAEFSVPRCSNDHGE